MNFKLPSAIKMIFYCSVTSLILVIILSAFETKKHPVVLIFSKTTGYHHASIPAGIAAIEKLGRENGFETDTTSDSKNFNART
ncbi:MAG TPA: ThuA domain-containing protein, partial [Flavisolibacter sp.]|nr:ThuA domain-containing protein [Flavisolibacter sp.]